MRIRLYRDEDNSEIPHVFIYYTVLIIETYIMVRRAIRLNTLIMYARPRPFIELHLIVMNW